MYSTGDVTLKRGIINSADLWAWISADPHERSSAKRDVDGHAAETKPASRCRRGSFTTPCRSSTRGPTLAAKGGGDVAMEELVLSVELVEPAD